MTGSPVKTPSQEKSLYATELETTDGRLALAAAAAAGRVGALLERAFETSGLRQDDLAETLGVSKSRVSQVLHGDGNLHIATLARFLSAMGYVVEVNARDSRGDVLINPARLRSRRRTGGPLLQSSMRMTWVDPSGVQTTDVTLHHTDPKTVPVLSQVECVSGVAKGIWQVLGDSGPAYQEAANQAASAEETRART